MGAGKVEWGGFWISEGGLLSAKDRCNFNSFLIAEIFFLKL